MNRTIFIWYSQHSRPDLTRLILRILPYKTNFVQILKKMAFPPKLWVMINTNVLSSLIFRQEKHPFSLKMTKGTLFEKTDMNATCFHKNFGKAKMLLLLLPYILDPHFEEKSTGITYHSPKCSDHKSYFERYNLQMSRKKKTD